MVSRRHLIGADDINTTVILNPTDQTVYANNTNTEQQHKKTDIVTTNTDNAA